MSRNSHPVSLRPDPDSELEDTEISLGDCSFPLRFNILRNSLTEAERKVGDYFLKNPKAVYLSITEVAQDSSLGYGSIIRFCRKIGCAGFQDFKVLLAQELSTFQESSKGKDSDLIYDYGEKLKSDLLNTIQLLDRNVLQKIARLLCQTRFVLTSGIAGSAALAHGFNYRLSRVGICSAVDCEGYTMAIRAAVLEPGDIFFAISFSGSTKDLLGAVEIAKERGAKIIALTNFIQSPLVDLADYSLFGATDRDPFSCEVFSNVTRDFVLDLLFVQICEIHPKAHETIQRTFEAISGRRI